MFPGSDLLSDAFQAIDPVTIGYKKWIGRVKSPQGQFVNTWADAEDVDASVQAVPRSLYQQYGLDFQKDYVNVFVELPVTDPARDVAGDVFVMPDGKRYQAISSNNWYGPDGGWQGGIGWVGPLLCVLLPSTVPTLAGDVSDA